MKSLKINGIDLSDPSLSKDDECSIVDTLASALRGTGNYLEPLFAEPAIQSYKHAIRNDVVVDPYGDALALSRKCDELRRYNRELSETVSGLLEERDALKSAIETQDAAFNAALTSRDRHLEAIRAELSALRKEVDTLRELRRVVGRMVALATDASL